MKFPYLKRSDPRDPSVPWISRPILPVRLFNRDKYLDFLALVDSGADYSLFNVQIAEALGIDLSDAESHSTFGIGGEGIKTVYRPIEMEVKGAGERLTIQAGFIDSKGVSALLGQYDFFDRYKVTFERAKERLELK